jgi:uncharacterized protein (TIGR02246 family)
MIADGNQAGDAQQAHDIAAGVEREWARRLVAGAPDAMIALYAQDALFFGSKARLYVGRAEIREYFEIIPQGYVRDARFTGRQSIWLKPDVILTSGYVTFVLLAAGVEQELTYRISFVLAETGEGWKIAQHHASPRDFEAPPELSNT